MASYRKMTERLMQEASTIAEERNTDITGEILREAADRIQNNGRKKAPPVPEGGVSQSEASRKYEIRQDQISRWVSKGYLPIKLRTNREVYVDEDILIELVKCYKKDPGQGKKTITKSL